MTRRAVTVGQTFAFQFPTGIRDCFHIQAWFATNPGKSLEFQFPTGIRDCFHTLAAASMAKKAWNVSIHDGNPRLLPPSGPTLIASIPHSFITPTGIRRKPFVSAARDVIALEVFQFPPYGNPRLLPLAAASMAKKVIDVSIPYGNPRLLPPSGPTLIASIPYSFQFPTGIRDCFHVSGVAEKPQTTKLQFPTGIRDCSGLQQSGAAGRNGTVDTRIFRSKVRGLPRCCSR